MESMPRPSFHVYAGIFLTCACLLVTEISLSRVFALCLWYHLAFLVISMAMFGLALGGLYIQLKQGSIDGKTLHLKLFYNALLMAVTSLLEPALLFRLKLPQELFQTFGFQTMFFLGWSFLLASLPFFFGGAVTALAFGHFSRHISKLYFADLLGAAAGCLLTIPLIGYCGAPNALLINALAGCVAGLIFLFGGRQAPPFYQVLRGLVVLVILASALVLNPTRHLFEARYAKGKDLGRNAFFKWDALSYVSVSKVREEAYVRGEAQYLWGVSAGYAGAFAPARFIKINEDAGTFLTSFDGHWDKVRWIQKDPPSLVHRLKTGARTLVIGAGGGKDVLTALSFGASHVTAVDLNPIIIHDVMQGRFRAFSGNLYQDPRVTAVAAEGRHFIASRPERYDIIQLSYVDTSVATSGGAYILAENNLYTKDSFKEYLNHLAPQGVFSVCWVDVPGLAGGTRLVSLSVRALEELGIRRAGPHILVITNANNPAWVIRDVLLKKEPFTPQEQQIIADAVGELGFEATYMPRQDALPGPLGDLHERKALIKAMINEPSLREALYARFPLDLRPTTDDRPFFYYQNRPRDFLKALKFNAPPGQAMATNGGVVLARMLMLALGLVFCFFALPMVLAGWSRGLEPLYFFCIGMGFMMLEIYFLQKYLLFLGHPVYSLSVTLLTILLFAGLGAFMTKHLTRQKPFWYARRVLALLSLLSLALAFGLNLVFEPCLGQVLTVKISVAVLMLAPLGLVMGMPLPLGIMALSREGRAAVPWMWGMNGAASVLACVLAMVLAMNLGYHFVLCLGVIFYIIAFLCIRPQ